MRVKRTKRPAPKAARPPPVALAWRVRARPLGDAAVRAAVRAGLAHGGRPRIGVSVVLVGDRELARMHARWLGDPARTDVITFDLGEGGGPAGELYVSVERALAVARERGVPAARELALYIVHGALHLCGFDDRTSADRRRMRAAESAVLDALGHPADPLPFESRLPGASAGSARGNRRVRARSVSTRRAGR